MDVDRHALVLTTWSSFVALITMSIIVACIHTGRTGKDVALCCETSKRWRFVPIPGHWSRRKRHFANSLLLIMAIMASIAQAIVIAFDPASETLMLLAAYNFVNLGFVWSFWAGDMFPYIQGVCVGSGTILMWVAVVFETYMTSEHSDGDPNQNGIGLFLLWGLAGASTVDFTFYVVLKFCCASDPNPALQVQLVAPLPARPTPNQQTPGYMYSIDDESSGSETDVTNVETNSY